MLEIKYAHYAYFIAGPNERSNYGDRYYMSSELCVMMNVSGNCSGRTSTGSGVLARDYVYGRWRAAYSFCGCARVPRHFITPSGARPSL